MKKVLSWNFAIMAILCFLSMGAFGQFSEANYDQRFNEYSQMNPTQKAIAFDAETPETKAALMKRNIAAKVNPLRLVPRQKEMVRLIFSKTSARAYTEGTPENQELKNLQTQAQTIFSVKELRTLFAVKEIAEGVDNFIFLSEISYSKNVSSSMEAYQCYCIDSSYDCPTGGYSCELYMQGCTAGGSCGWMGLYTCRGGCKYTGEMEIQ